VADDDVLWGPHVAALRDDGGDVGLGRGRAGAGLPARLRPRPGAGHRRGRPGRRGLAVEERADAVFLLHLEGAPAYQGRGLGTASGGARARALPVALRVLKVNPARRRYERLGGRVPGETATHYLLQTAPAARPLR
jgi:hypothetical protein